MSLPFLPGSFVLGSPSTVEEEEEPTIVAGTNRVQLADLNLKFPQELGRRLIGQLSVLAGSRSSGFARVVATGDPVQLAANAFAIPVKKDLARANYLVKVAHNPETVNAHLVGGSWTVTSAGLDVRFTANVGGSWGVPAGEVLRFDPPIPGLEREATVLSPGITGGSITPSILNRVVFYDELDANQELEFFRAHGGNFPAVVLGWIRRVPIEGRQGASPGRAKKGQGRRMYYENFVAIAVSGNARSADTRWAEVSEIAQGVVELLQDRRRSDDGERLSADRGIQIIDVTRGPKTKSSQSFRVLFRTESAWSRRDARSFAPWLRTRYVGSAAATVDNPGRLDVHDFIDEMPRGL